MWFNNHLIKRMEIPLTRLKIADPTLLQQIVANMASHRITLIVKVYVHVLPES